jgi:hypothetical protein
VGESRAKEEKMKKQATLKVYGSEFWSKVGDEVIVMEYSSIFGDSSTWKLIPIEDCPDGIPGNANHSVKRYHGWRGTTDDIACYAHGVREIESIAHTSNPDYLRVRVGKDLHPDWE